jgi:hypothetical protein
MQTNFHAQNQTNRIVNLFLLLVVMLLATACGALQAPAGESATSEVYYAEEAAMAPAPDAAMRGENFADGEAVPVEDFLARATQAQEMRVIIYTGNISLIVRDTESAVQAITQLAAEQGGYVSGSNVYQSGEALRGTVTIRVPADRYQQAMEQLRALALRVERESSSSQDVTEEFTDLQARKANLEVTEAALQKLLTERQQIGNTSDILEVHRELTNIRGQIEQIEGRLRYLANQSALSTITIELTPDALYQPITVAGWEPQGVAKEALQALIDALQALANIVIWLIVFVLPLLIIFLIPLVVVVVIIRMWWRRRQKRPKPEPSAPEPPSEPVT